MIFITGENFTSPSGLSKDHKRISLPFTSSDLLHIQQKSLLKVYKDQSFALLLSLGKLILRKEHCMYDDGTEAYSLETEGFFVQKRNKTNKK